MPSQQHEALVQQVLAKIVTDALGLEDQRAGVSARIATRCQVCNRPMALTRNPGHLAVSVGNSLCPKFQPQMMVAAQHRRMGPLILSIGDVPY